MRHPHPTASPHQLDASHRAADDRLYGDAALGLAGPRDHVRRLWEDQSTRFALAPAVERLVRACREDGRGLRILDLGHGFGEGWDLLRRIPAGRPPCTQVLFDAEDVVLYRGVGLTAGAEALAAARARFAALPQASFAACPPARPESCLDDLPPCDLYLAGRDSLAGLAPEALARTVAAFAAHQAGPCALALDLPGRHCPHSPAGQGWTGPGLRAALLAIPALRNRLTGLALTDRALLVGRSGDLAASPLLRQAVNGLFEHNHAIDPADLRAGDPAPCGDAEADQFMAGLHRGWDALVGWFARLVGHDPRPAPAPGDLACPGGPLPPGLLPGMAALAAQARDCAWFTPGDPLANLLQPQFGFLLRQYEVHLQRGLGCGRGLVAVAELASVARTA